MGEYASGKSEVALNRALALLKAGRRKVTLVDFDLVEPFYTLRPLKKELEEKGLSVLAWDSDRTMGLGEAGNLLKPEMRWALKSTGDVIFDVGYGVYGAQKLNLVEGANDGPVVSAGNTADSRLKIIVVLNIARPLTGDYESILEYVRELLPVDGLINNSHLGDDTDVEIIQEGARVVSEAAKTLQLPLIGTTAELRFAEALGSKDAAGNPIFYLERHMQRAFW